MALELRWVEAIHTRLLVRYGSKWMSMWAGVPEDMVRADWASELHGLSGDAIGYALEHLPPDFPPTVAQFKALAIGRRSSAPSLPAPRDPMPAHVAAKLAEIGREHRMNPRAWAERLRQDDEAGKPLSVFQRHCYREALAMGNATWD